MFKLPKFKSVRKVYTVKVSKTGVTGKVVKCEKRGGIYWYLIQGDDTWYAEFELKEVK